MSLDANYILSYDPYHSNKEPTVQQIDMKFLEDKYEYGGEFFIFDGGRSIYWAKNKHLINREDLKYLMADRVLEKLDCQQWEIIK